MRSNGGSMHNGTMELAFFGTREVRESLLEYRVPEWMRMAIPLGLDGSGNFALLDVRASTADNEHPVLVAAAGNLGFEDAALLATSFEGFCRLDRRVEDVLHERPPEAPERDARCAAATAARVRSRAIDLGDLAFRAGEYARAAELLAPYRGTLVRSLEAKLRIAERKAAAR